MKKIEITELTPFTIAPDGVQGGKVVLGIRDQAQVDELKQAVEISGGGFNIRNIRDVASQLNIPVVDH